MAISTSLGERREVELPQGRVEYRERGSGPPLVFLHGLITNADLWRKVVPLFSGDHRCIAPDLPLGSHAIPLRPDADLTPPGVARLIADFLEALELEEATLVSVDTATAFTQMVMANHPERVGRVVLGVGDAFKNFLPPFFRPLTVLAHVPGALWLSSQLNRPTWAQRLGYMTLSKQLKDPAILESFTKSGRTDAGVRRDGAKALRGIRNRYTIEAATRLHRFERPVLLAWAEEDKFFPMSDAERLAQILPDARLETVTGSLTYIPEDQPQQLAGLMRGFLDATAVPSGPGAAADRR